MKIRFLAFAGGVCVTILAFLKSLAERQKISQSLIYYGRTMGRRYDRPAV